MALGDYQEERPPSLISLLSSLMPALLIVATAAIVTGFGLGQTFQNAVSDLAGRSDLLTQAVDALDEALSTADDHADAAQTNLKSVFEANGVTAENPMPPENKGPIRGEEPSPDNPAPLPQPLPPGPEPTLKGVAQLRAANDEIAKVRESLDVQVYVPEEAQTGFGLFGTADAARKTHKTQIPAQKPNPGPALSTIILVGTILFLAGLTVYSMRMYNVAATPSARKLYERLSICLVTFFVLAAAGMFGTYLGVKIVLPS